MLPAQSVKWVTRSAAVLAQPGAAAIRLPSRQQTADGVVFIAHGEAVVGGPLPRSWRPRPPVGTNCPMTRCTCTTAGHRPLPHCRSRSLARPWPCWRAASGRNTACSAWHQWGWCWTRWRCCISDLGRRQCWRPLSADRQRHAPRVLSIHEVVFIACLDRMDRRSDIFARRLRCRRDRSAQCRQRT